jgi:quinol-cytochrome oxidoreductase complex cytochrome b subunit
MLKIIGMAVQGTPGEILGMLLFGGALVLWMLIPFYDTSKESGVRGRNATYYGLVVVIALLATTVYGYWTLK